VARISDIAQPTDPRDPKRIEDRLERQTSETRDTEQAPRTDSVSISTQAQETDALQTQLTEEAANIPDVREDRVADVKARIASGEFDADSDEVKQAVAEGLLDQMGI
jgi:negative regulator of flagellin synthesis FlgM